MDNTPTIHNKALKEEIAETVLMPGDPLRAKYIAENLLEGVKLVNSTRGMFGYTGTYKGKRVTIQGSGMGIPSMALYSYELFNYYNVDNIIRVGSTGALSAEIELNTLLIPIGAATDSNYQRHYNLPGTFTPPASFSLLSKAVKNAEEMNISFCVCNIVTSDVFYFDDPQDIFRWCKMGIKAVDMETAGLYLNAARSGKNALSILTVSDNIVTHEAISPKAREKAFTDMILLSLSLI